MTSKRSGERPVRPSSWRAGKKYKDKIKFQSLKGKTKKSFRFAPLINSKNH